MRIVYPPVHTAVVVWEHLAGTSGKPSASRKLAPQQPSLPGLSTPQPPRKRLHTPSRALSRMETHTFKLPGNRTSWSLLVASSSVTSTSEGASQKLSRSSSSSPGLRLGLGASWSLLASSWAGLQGKKGLGLGSSRWVGCRVGAPPCVKLVRRGGAYMLALYEAAANWYE